MPTNALGNQEKMKEIATENGTVLYGEGTFRQD